MTQTTRESVMVNENNNIRAGSTEWYQAELNKDMIKLSKMMDWLDKLVEDVKIEGVSGSSFAQADVSPSDGLASVTELISRIGSLGVSIAYNRNKIIDKKIFDLED